MGTGGGKTSSACNSDNFQAWTPYIIFALKSVHRGWGFFVAFAAKRPASMPKWTTAGCIVAAAKTCQCNTRERGRESERGRTEKNNRQKWRTFIFFALLFERTVTHGRDIEKAKQHHTTCEEERQASVTSACILPGGVRAASPAFYTSNHCAFFAMSYAWIHQANKHSVPKNRIANR